MLDKEQDSMAENPPYPKNPPNSEKHPNPEKPPNPENPPKPNPHRTVEEQKIYHAKDSIDSTDFSHVEVKYARLCNKINILNAIFIGRPERHITKQ